MRAQIEHRDLPRGGAWAFKCASIAAIYPAAATAERARKKGNGDDCLAIELISNDERSKIGFAVESD